LFPTVRRTRPATTKAWFPTARRTPVSTLGPWPRLRERLRREPGRRDNRPARGWRTPRRRRAPSARSWETTGAATSGTRAPSFSAASPTLPTAPGGVTREIGGNRASVEKKKKRGARFPVERIRRRFGVPRRHAEKLLVSSRGRGDSAGSVPEKRNVFRRFCRGGVGFAV
jgi:hypothetical protein